MAIPFASQHTASFPPLLRQLGGSVLASTYQAGQLIILRDQGSESLNTHFCAFDKPMGLAADNQKLVVGTGFQVWELRNLPAVAPKVEPHDRHDACYLPRQVHVTGDIDIHEMAFGEEDELWLVNTRLSCLCTLDKAYSVVPRWRPPFVSAYDLTDRCHLNGLALKNGQPAFVTALGATDASEGWRANKAKGGVLMEVPSGRIIAESLSMPHSPRWHNDRLWYLESGAGRLCQVNLVDGKQEVIAELPGFTRGLDFVGRYAFVGLSQVRETAVFSGLPLTARVADRQCGVWVVDTEQRRVVACVVFTGAVMEIFAVQILPWRFPALLDMGDPLVRSSYSLPDEALLEIAPVDPLQTRLEQATAIHRQGDYEQAIMRYRELLNLRPDHLTARYQLGLALVDAERWQEAEVELLDVVTRQPLHAEAHNSLGVSYMERMDDDRALHHFEQAIAADRQYAIAHFNRSLALLKSGDYRQGWEEYDWRWQMPTFTPFECPQPLWQGENIQDKTLLVHAEQGHGDAIQFARFLPLAAQRCKKLILACTEPLRPLFASLPSVAETRLAGSIPLDSFDVYCPLLTLPRALEITLDNLSAQTPYLTVPNHISVPTLANDGRLRVGLTWAGSRTYKKDNHRSCPLEQFIPLFSVQDIAWYSLQKPLNNAENVVLETHSVFNLEPELTDYARTAAYVQQLDLIISVDTSVAHLAGALAKPVWVLVAQNADWRWLREREDSPWYPSVRLFRQTVADNWVELIKRVEMRLQQEFKL